MLCVSACFVYVHESSCLLHGLFQRFDVALSNAASAPLLAYCLACLPAGPVRLLTHPTSAGYTQNPISVYYCYSADGSQLEQCIAEVTNTPWAERVTFLFR
jgi:DUF1365 family protein